MLTESGKNVRIVELPELSELENGYFVPVDSNVHGTKKFDLSDLTTAIDGKADASEIEGLQEEIDRKASTDEIETLESQIEGKVDSPDTAPTTGQVLMFDGTDNVWSDPPEGVYVLNYTEIGSFTDIDVDRMNTQPTFVRIDAAQSITIKTSLTNTITIPLEIGTMMRLVEQSISWAVFVAEKVQSYPTGPDNAAFGANTCHVNILLRICRSDVSSTTKVFSCYGDIEDTNALFNESPMPCTMHYQNARGADLDTGNVFTQYTGRATAVQFNSASGKYRRNLLMPEEIQSHDFTNDSTPELIQFMGWGATSNRTGYKICLAATHSDTATYPIQTPEVNFIRSVIGPSETEDNVICTVHVVTKSANGGDQTAFGGILIPRTRPGVLKYWNDNNGSHLDFKPVNEVPASTSSDSGKVLTVAANGTPRWGNAIGFIKNVGSLTDASTITATTLNNGFATLSTSQPALTIVDVVGTDEVVNFAIEITPSVNCTLTIQKKVGDNSSVTLKHSVAGGNTLEANKTYQVTAVGNCWTLAEFTA